MIAARRGQRGGKGRSLSTQAEPPHFTSTRTLIVRFVPAIVVLFIAATLGFSFWAPAGAVTTGSISGTVVAASNSAPLSGICVQAQQTGGQIGSGDATTGVGRHLHHHRLTSRDLHGLVHVECRLWQYDQLRAAVVQRAVLGR